MLQVPYILAYKTHFFTRKLEENVKGASYKRILSLFSTILAGKPIWSKLAILRENTKWLKNDRDMKKIEVDL